jgi:hypothetical protein
MVWDHTQDPNEIIHDNLSGARHIYVPQGNPGWARQRWAKRDKGRVPLHFVNKKRIFCDARVNKWSFTLKKNILNEPQSTFPNNLTAILSQASLIHSWYAQVPVNAASF